MTPPVPSRRRRAAVMAAFIVGVVATAATSPSFPTIKVAPAGGTFQLDPSNPAAVSRIVFRANAEATTGDAVYDVSVRLDQASAPGAKYGTVDPALVRVIATSSPPVAASATDPPSPSPGPGLTGSGSSKIDGWQADLTSTYSAKLPIDCGEGPCERTFWVLAVLAGDASGEVDVKWSVDGTVGWSARAAPSAAAAGATIDAPIAISGPASALTATTEAETIQFGPDRPTAARVVEVTADAATIRADGGPTAALTVATTPKWAYDPADTVGNNNWLQVDVYPLDGPLATAGGGGAPSSGAAGPLPSDSAALNAAPPSNGASPSPPAALPSGADPFAGCPAGRACTRRFLVSLALTREGYMPADTSGKPRPFQWQLTVRRTDLISAWASPSTMAARITRRFDITAGTAPVTTHLEGDVLAVASGPSTPAHVLIGTSTTSAEPIARLLPVAAAMTLRVAPPAVWPDPTLTRVQVDVQVDAQRPTTAYQGQVADGTVVVTGNPAVVEHAVCRVGTECPDLKISVGMQGQSPPQVSYHWSLDISVYSYTDVPVALTTQLANP